VLLRSAGALGVSKLDKTSVVLCLMTRTNPLSLVYIGFASESICPIVSFSSKRVPVTRQWNIVLACGQEGSDQRRQSIPASLLYGSHYERMQRVSGDTKSFKYRLGREHFDMDGKLAVQQ
jgi:hypothetical protein